MEKIEKEFKMHKTLGPVVKSKILNMPGYKPTMIRVRDIHGYYFHVNPEMCRPATDFEILKHWGKVIVK